jgi:hypothetical protein
MLFLSIRKEVYNTVKGTDVNLQGWGLAADASVMQLLNRHLKLLIRKLPPY